MDVSGLEELDRLVAIAEGIENEADWTQGESFSFSGLRAPVQGKSYFFRPSSSWNDGGPIIERERITVQASQAGDWRAFLGDGTTNAGTGRRANEPMIQARGDTPLIAAMRCYVASKS
jgi:hypothetical protein